MLQIPSMPSHTTSERMRFYVIDDTYAVWYEDFGISGCQAHIILVEDLPEDAHIIDVREEKK